MAEVHRPNAKIALASSFEGIVNDGAPECALVSINAYEIQNPDSITGRRLTAADFNQGYVNSPTVRAFLALRPMVENAEDYHTVLDLVIGYPHLFENPNDPEVYAVLEERFQGIKELSRAKRDEFGKGKASLFYKERERLQQEDYDGWLNTQKPFDDTLPQFRALVDGQIWDGDQPVRGFFPRFATSKDEASAYALCNFYAKVRKLDPGDVEGAKCVIPRDGIIGMETVPSRNKVEQLKVIADRLDVPRSHVWRLNDRYDPKQQEQLYKAGFTYQFFLPGYATPSEIERAKSDGLVRTLERTRFAEQLGEFAREWRF